MRFQRAEREAGGEGSVLEGTRTYSWPIACSHFAWLQLHVQGKTDQAKADLARLAKIRKEREEAQAKRKAETEGLFLISLSFMSL
jgi:hypothetical protein